MLILYGCMRKTSRNIDSHRDLKVWQRSIELTLNTYRLSSVFPRSEQFGLTSQLRRASVSIAANIAEGNGRHTDRDYAHFLSMAIGSAREVDTLLVITGELGYGNREDHHRCLDLLGEINRMLESIHARLSGQ